MLKKLKRKKKAHLFCVLHILQSIFKYGRNIFKNLSAARLAARQTFFFIHHSKLWASYLRAKSLVYRLHLLHTFESVDIKFSWKCINFYFVLKNIYHIFRIEGVLFGLNFQQIDITVYLSFVD